MTSTSSLSSSSSSGVGSLSSPGLGSGLDVNSIVSALVGSESIPLNSLKAAETNLQTQLSTFGTVQSDLAAFRDAARTLADPTTWNQTAGTSSNAAVVGITTGSNTPTGAYSVEVSQLAASQTLASTGFTSSASTVGSGSMSIQLGTWSADKSSFAAGSGAAVNISIAATDTLADVRDKINGAGAGVTASILNDSTGSRLVLRSTTTGEANGFKIGVTDDDGGNADTSGLSKLAYDPSAHVASMSQTQAAADAKATINGLPVSSSINTLTQVLDGITLTLGGLTPVGSPVSLSVATDSDALKKSITTFVTAYNQLNSYLADQTKYDAATKTAGTLQGDSTANGIRTQLRGLLGAASGASSVYKTLSAIGFDVQKDGTINIKDAKLSSALTNVAEVKKLFTNTDTAHPENDGIASRLRDLSDGMLGVNGVLSTRSTGLQARISRNEDNQARMQDHIDQYEARVRAQYTALDSTMATMSAMSTYLTQQLAAMNKSNN